MDVNKWWEWNNYERKGSFFRILEHSIGKKVEEAGKIDWQKEKVQESSVKF